MLFLPLPSFGFSLSSPFQMRKGVFDLSITHNSWNSWRAEGGKFLNFSLLLLSSCTRNFGVLPASSVFFVPLPLVSEGIDAQTYSRFFS
jgi:hypothetical protein